MATGTQWISDRIATSIVFGPFRVFPMQRLLTHSGKPVHLGSRAFDILVALLERPGELVGKEELTARVWPNTFVGPANLAVQIGALRRALGDGRRGNRYVVNIPGRGYRFVAPVTVEAGLPAEPAAASPLPEPGPPTPFTPRTTRAETVDEAIRKPQQRRVVTIVRPGGIGKAKAALAVVEKLLGANEDGVWVLEMSQLEEP